MPDEDLLPTPDEQPLTGWRDDADSLFLGRVMRYLDDALDADEVAELRATWRPALPGARRLP